MIGIDRLLPGNALGAEVARFLAGIDFHATLMDGMLSFLLFAGALHVDWSEMRKGRWPILVFSTIGGTLFGKLMYVVTGGKVNPLIGSAGVSAVPMAARVSQVEGQRANPKNYLLMHAMGPNVAGVIGSAVAAGFLLAMFG